MNGVLLFSPEMQLLHKISSCVRQMVFLVWRTYHFPSLSFCLIFAFTYFCHIYFRFFSRCFYVFCWSTGKSFCSHSWSKEKLQTEPQGSPGFNQRVSSSRVWREWVPHIWRGDTISDETPRQPRLVVLIGKIQGMSGHSKWVILYRPSESHFLYFCRISWCSDQWAEAEGDCWESSSLWCCCATWVYFFH